MSELIAPLNVATLSRSGENIKIEADEQMLTALAAACGVTSFEGFSVFMKASRFKKGGAKLAGSLSASLTQPCVVTTDPVSQHIELEIERRFLPANEIARREQRIEDGELILDPDETDEPDEIENGQIDLWQVLVEELCLEIELHPRKQGAEMPPNLAGDQTAENHADEPENRPFASLNTLINQKKT